VAASSDEAWQPARIIPVTGLSGSDEQERRGCSAFLAVLGSVREFGRAITARCGAPAGTIETFIEVPFKLGDATYRPDGVIRVRRGQREWIALVEVKTGRNELGAAQVNAYVDIAREQGFNAVVTISNEIPTAPGVHPVNVEKKKLKKVSLHHLSWSKIHTEELIERLNHAISDPVQAWILTEFIRYLEYPKSGALDFDDMGPSWVTVRDSASKRTLRAGDSETLDVVSRFDQLIAFAGMQLARQLGVHVQPALARSDLADPAARIQKQAATLAKTGELTGGLLVPDAIAPISITVDLLASRVDASVAVAAPTSGRATTRVNWILRQLRDAPSGLSVKVRTVRSRGDGPSQSLSSLLDDPTIILEDASADIRTFTLTLSHPAGTKRGQGRGSFVGSVLDLVDRFYAEVVQTLKPWTPSAPRLKTDAPDGSSPDQQVAKVSDITSATEGAAEVTGVLPVLVAEKPDEEVSWLSGPPASAG
jgi:hypothetical protein